MSSTSPVCDLPDERDLHLLLSCRNEAVDKTKIGKSVGAKLSGAFAAFVADSEDVFRERILDSYDFDIEWYGLPFIRIVMFPDANWFAEVKAKSCVPPLHRDPSEHPMYFAPTVSLAIQPPIQQHVNGPWPAHYVLGLHQPNSQLGVLMARLWKDWQRMFRCLCARLDIAMSGSGRPLSMQLDSSKSLDDRLAACFSEIDSRPEESWNSEDYSAHLDFGFPFGENFESGKDAFRLMYPILSSALGYGINDKDRMLTYVGRLGSIYNTNLPQLFNYLHEDRILRKTYYCVKRRKRAKRSPQ